MNKRPLYRFDEFLLDTGDRRVYRGNEVVTLPPKAVELLTILVENCGKDLEKDDLIDRLWGDTFVEDSNLTQTIYLLRKALSGGDGGKSLIITLPKRGYRFVGHVRTVTEDGEGRILDPPEPASLQLDAEFDRLQTQEPSPESDQESDGQISGKRLWIVTSAASLLIALGIYGLFSGSSTVRHESITSIAVMPFNVIGSGDEFIGMGIADTLITRLGRSGKISVRSTDETRYVTTSISDPVEVGRRLGVDAILTGNVQRADKMYRLNVQLIDVEDGHVIWSEHFDENQPDIFSLQDDLTFRLIGALTINIPDAERAGLVRRSTNDPEAIGHYWRGRYFWSQRNPESISAAAAEFESAIARDPNFALAYAGLADSYAITASGLNPAERFPKAKAAALRALELDDTLAEAHTSLAFVLYKREWNWDQAEQHFKRAIEINDSYATAHHWFGEFLILQARFDEGLAELRKAEQIDPFSLAIKADFGEGLYRARRMDEAIVFLQRTIGSYPRHPKFYQVLKRAYKISGLPIEAVKADMEQCRIVGNSCVGGSFSEAPRDYWTERLRRSGADTEPTNLLDLYFQLDDHESMLRLLEMDTASLDYLPLVLKVEPMFDQVRSDPRFIKLLQQVNFPE